MAFPSNELIMMALHLITNIGGTWQPQNGAHFTICAPRHVKHSPFKPQGAKVRPTGYDFDQTTLHHYTESLD
jgi:hypothetical protein